MSLKAIRAALVAAFPYTIPIFAGFWFLGMSYGIYMHALGFGFIYPLLMSMLIFGGSLEFVAGSMLASAFAPLQTFIIAFMIQARHLFYGISMLDKYTSDTGLKRWYLIYGMCDESFSINYVAKVPEGINKGWFWFWVTILNQCYWVSGSFIGAMLGSALPFDTTGVSFAMTALFTVIMLETFLNEKDHTSTLIGFGASVACLLLFGADNFLIPTMLVILALLTAMRQYIAQRIMPQELADAKEGDAA